MTMTETHASARTFAPTRKYSPAGYGDVPGRAAKFKFILHPTLGNDFFSGIEFDAVFAVGMQVTVEGIFPAGEWEERHRCRNTNIYAEHAGIDRLPEFANTAAVAG